jgi:hypothetical protein
VVANSDPSQSGFDTLAQDWAWTRDVAGATVSLAVPGKPLATTAAATAVTDHAAKINGVVDPQLLDAPWAAQFGPTASYGAATASQPAVPGSATSPAQVSVALSGLRANTMYHYRLTATNTLGTGTGADMTFTTARDVTPPLLTLKVGKRQRMRSARAGGIALSASCSEPCTGAAQLRIPRGLAKRLRLPVVLGSVRVNLGAPFVTKKLRLRLARSVGPLPLGVRRLGARLVVTVADDSGNRRSVSRAFSLTR